MWNSLDTSGLSSLVQHTGFALCFSIAGAHYRSRKDAMWALKTDCLCNQLGKLSIFMSFPQSLKRLIEGRLSLLPLLFQLFFASSFFFKDKISAVSDPIHTTCATYRLKTGHPGCLSVLSEGLSCEFDIVMNGLPKRTAICNRHV